MGANGIKRKPVSLKKKILIFALSFVFFLILLEVSLRFAGHLYLLKRVACKDASLAFSAEKKMYVVLCAGDSFTFGGDLPFELSYPFQLERILRLKKPNSVFKVVNAGVCEQNSSQLLQSLPKNIKYYQPDAVILLVGASNWFNFVGFKKDNTFCRKIKDAFLGLRIYKMAKIIALNLEQKFFVMKFKQKTEPKFYKFLYDYSSFRSAVDPDKPVLDEAAERRLQRVDYFMQVGEKEKASKLFRKIFEIDSGSDLFLYQVKDFLEHINRTIGEREGKKYEPDLIKQVFQKKLENNRQDKMFYDYLLFVQNIQKFYKNEEIEKRLREDIEGIVEVCRKNNVKLILQDYPSPYRRADAILRDIANKHSLPIVKNGEVFGELLKVGKTEAYFLNDSHCTPLGYRLMAENIYKAILYENIFPEK